MHKFIHGNVDGIIILIYSPNHNMNYNAWLLIMIFVLTCSSHAQDNGAKMNSKETKLLVDSLCATLRRWYIYPDKAEVISQAITGKLKAGGYNKVQNRLELGEMLNEDIRKVHYDGHMRVGYAPEQEKMLLTELTDSMRNVEDEMEIEYEQSNNFYFTRCDILPGNIGYVRWDQFAEHTREARSIFEAAFKFVSNTHALIIDMRYCRGGWPPTVNAMLNYFFVTKLPMNHIISYRHDTVKYFTNPSMTPFKLSMPVYILTSKRTFSGAEDFTYAMKIAKRATIVGDTTGGGAHPVETVPLGQGFVLRIPNARSYNEVTKTDWEGTGVYPDAYVKGEYALEKAQVMIFQNYLVKAANDEERQQMQGLLTAAENNFMLVKNGGVNYSGEPLQKFCGVYKPVPGLNSSPVDVTIFIKNCSLFRSIPYPPDWKLNPISNTRFLYDNDETNRYIEFSLNTDGQVTGLVIYYTDGRTFSYEKKK